MSSTPEHDLVDYVTDDSLSEDGSLFLPTPAGPAGGDAEAWIVPFLGFLGGLAGGALVPIAPWLGGALVVIGYGLAAFSMRGSTSCAGRAVRFGFVVTAILGVTLLAGMATKPLAILHLLSEAGERRLTFTSFALMPWAFAVLKLCYLLVARLFRGKRRNGVQPA
jgi:hypothetical protein